jgi:hypothetical protein
MPRTLSPAVAQPPTGWGRTARLQHAAAATLGFDATYSAGVDELFFNGGMFQVTPRGGQREGADATTVRPDRMRGTAAAGNVHAKTGFVDTARSLSGSVTMADGRVLIFSVLCNNWTTPSREVDQVADAIAVRIAGLRGR